VAGPGPVNEQTNDTIAIAAREAERRSGCRVVLHPSARRWVSQPFWSCQTHHGSAGTVLGSLARGEKKGD
jgi:hypothetical protein